MSTAGFDTLFRATRREVDDVLSEVPRSLLEARRLITRELQFDPRPEELQAIVKIAAFMSTSIMCFELPRQLLALRVLAERELNDFSGSRRLSPDKLSRTGGLVEELLLAAERSNEDLSTDAESMSALASEERKFLLHIRDALVLPRERLRAAATLSPRLELVAKQISTGDIRETFPGLSDEEIEMLNQAVHLDEEEPAGPGRVCLDAIALRTVFEEFLAVWDRSGYLEDSELIERLRQGIREQLSEAETAYRVVNGQLQRQQDEAISANLEDFAEDIRAAKSKLFDAYIKTQPLMRAPEVVDAEVEVDRRPLAETLAEAETADDRATRRVGSDELYLEALTHMRQDRAAGRDLRQHPLEVARRKYRRRLWTLAATIAILGVAAGVVHFLLPQPAPEPVLVSLREFEPALSVIDARPIGTMLYVRVADWDQLSVQKMRFRTAAIGEVAAENGLVLAYVVSDTGRALSEWHINGGVLVQSTSGASGDVISQSKARDSATGN